MLKPSCLSTGDVIGLVSPSSGLAGLLPHRVERVRTMLTEMGFGVKIGRHALQTRGYVSGTAQERAADFQGMFEDPEVKAVMSFIGGNHSNQLLPHLDFESIRKHPKIFVGYSDMTVLHLALQTRSNLVSFYGPAGLTQFGEHPRILPYTREHFERATIHPEPIGEIIPSTEWTDEVLDWMQKKDLERPRKLLPNPGYRWLREGTAVGPILGGCVTSLLHLRGTPYWPDFTGSIFFWETPEGSPDFTRGCDLSKIDAALADLALSGVFSQIAGMVVGRSFGYTEEERSRLRDMIESYVRDYDFPVLLDADFGHTDPMITIPIGVQTKLDSAANSFALLESGVL